MFTLPEWPFALKASTTKSTGLVGDEEDDGGGSGVCGPELPWCWHFLGGGHDEDKDDAMVDSSGRGRFLVGDGSVGEVRGGVPVAVAVAVVVAPVLVVVDAESFSRGSSVLRSSSIDMFNVQTRSLLCLGRLRSRNCVVTSSTNEVVLVFALSFSFVLLLLLSLCRSLSVCSPMLACVLFLQLVQEDDALFLLCPLFNQLAWLVSEKHHLLLLHQTQAVPTQPTSWSHDGSVGGKTKKHHHQTNDTLTKTRTMVGRLALGITERQVAQTRQDENHEATDT